MSEEGVVPDLSPPQQYLTLTELTNLLQSAEAGNNKSRFDLGRRLWFGKGIATDKFAAEQWLQKAAVDGFGPAQLAMGHIWRLGLNGKHCSRIAAFWYRQSADNGLAEGLFGYGCCFRDGEGETRDLARFYCLMQKAAEAGSVQAMLLLGDGYLTGFGLSKNWARALHWYKCAARAGDVASHLLIGQIYRHGGFGVSIHTESAIDHLRIAAENEIWQARVELARTLLHRDPQSKEAAVWLKKGLEFADEADILSALERLNAGQIKITQWQQPRPPMRLPSEVCSYALKELVELTAHEAIVYLSDLGDHQAELEYAETLWREKKRLAALTMLERSARGGLAEAQYRMALMYQGGFLADHAKEMQAYWCNLAATQGHEAAKNMLAILYEEGEGLGYLSRREQRDEAGITPPIEPLNMRSTGPADEFDFSIEEVVETKSAGTLYRRMRPGHDPLVVIKVNTKSVDASGRARSLWLKVPSHIDTVAGALLWGLKRIPDARDVRDESS